jgi:hypothetical protein
LNSPHPIQKLGVASTPCIEAEVTIVGQTDSSTRSFIEAPPQPSVAPATTQNKPSMEAHTVSAQSNQPQIMQTNNYTNQNSDHCEAFNEDPTQNSWSKNELRTVIFVAAKEIAPRSALTSFQSQLPSSDWFGGQYEGKWHPMKDHLSWGNIQIDAFRKITLGDMIKGILGMKGGVNSKEGIYADDVLSWMNSPDAQKLLREVITIPHSELGVKLGHKHDYATIKLYKSALELCSEPEETAVFGALINIMYAAEVLRRTISEITPRYTYHFTKGNAAVIATALLTREPEVIQRGDEIKLVKHEEDDFAALLISSTLKKKQFLKAFDIQPDAISRNSPKKKTDTGYSSMCQVRSILNLLARPCG